MLQMNIECVKSLSKRSNTIKWRRELQFNQGSVTVVLLQLLIAFGTIVLPPLLEIAFAIGLTMIIVVMLNTKKSATVKTTIFILPVVLSAFQNIYLGLAADRMTQLEVQILLTLNMLLVILSVFIYMGVHGIKRKDAVAPGKRSLRGRIAREEQI